MNRLFSSALWVLATGFVGYTLMLAVTPNSEQMRKKFPEANAKYYAAEKTKNKTFMSVLKEAAESDEPIYRKSGKRNTNESKK